MHFHERVILLYGLTILTQYHRDWCHMTENSTNGVENFSVMQ